MKSCFKYRIFKLISALICISFLFSSFYISSYAVENNDEISRETFYEEFEIMMDESDNYNSTIKIESIENGETIIEDKISTNRLIVSTDSNCNLSKNYGAISKIEGYNNWHIFQYKSYEEASLAYEAFSQSDSINFVEFDNLIEIEETDIEISNNIDCERLSWGAEYVQSVTANEAIVNSKMNLEDVVVAVIDSGVDSTHSFFDSDSDMNGSRVLSGNRNNDNVAYYDHGTHVAGIIVDNTLPNVKIKSYNFFYYNGKNWWFICVTCI